jgi:hypothetical protein
MDLPAVGEQVFGIHHPNGAVKKLSIPHPGFTLVTSSGVDCIGVSLDVSGGSSGSGLFDTAGRITGVLSNGVACGLDYFPTATIQQDIATPPVITRDVMLVFDRSGSMSLPGTSGLTKIEEARAAASLFVQLVRAGTGNRVGVVSFSTTASSPVDFPLADVTAGSKNTLIGPSPFTGGIVGGLTPGGSTTIGGGLNAAYANQERNWGRGQQDHRPKRPPLKPAARLEIHAAFLPQGDASQHHRADGNRDCHIKQQFHQIDENLWQRHDLFARWHSAFLVHARRAVLDPEFDQSCKA